MPLQYLMKSTWKWGEMRLLQSRDFLAGPSWSRVIFIRDDGNVNARIRVAPLSPCRHKFQYKSNFEGRATKNCVIKSPSTEHLFLL